MANDVILSKSNEIGIVYSSINPDTIEQKKLLYKVINSPDCKLKDYINKNILLKDVYIENISLIDEETGEVSIVPRVILIDTENKSYTATSRGIMSSMIKVISVFGYPSEWEEPLTITVKSISTKTLRNTLIIEVV